MRFHGLTFSALGIALAAATAAAQAPGTVELNGFASYTKFDNKSPTRQDNLHGGGGRIGVFFLNRWEVEGELDYARINLLGGGSEEYAPAAARVNYNFPFSARNNSSFLLGLGATRSSHQGGYNWGTSAIAGLRLGVGPVAVRGDVSYAYLPSPKSSEVKGTLGLSFMTRPVKSYRADYARRMGMLPQPGTLEIGAFGQYSHLDGSYNVDQNGIGFGGRVGAFITPNWEIEGDGSYTKLDRTAVGTSGSLDVTPIALRLNYNIPFASRASFILGAGVTRFDLRGVTTDVGPTGLVGARVMLTPRFAIRADGLVDYLPDSSAYNFGARLGLSAFVGGARPGAVPPVIVTLSPASASLQVGQTQQLTTSATQEGRTLDRTFTCVSSDAAVATIDANRVVTAVGPGTATITCTTGTLSATSTITVTAPPPPPPPAVDSSAILRARQDSIDAANAAMARGLVIYFDFDRSTLRPDSRAILDSLITKVKAGGSDVTVVVEGHTDSRGSDEYNLALGQRRASAAKRYMVANGIPSAKVTVRSFGEECPVVPNATTEDEHQQNRRDEFVLTISGNTMQSPSSAAAKSCSATTGQ